MKRMLITAAVLLTAVALMLSAGCAKDKKNAPRNVGRHDRRSGDILDLFRKNDASVEYFGNGDKARREV